MCTNENIDAPWVNSLGFTYKKQGQPLKTWMNETIREHKIPLGGEIFFYCKDESRRKRPKKDNFDDDKDDGLLSGYCTYTGKVNIPMTPAGRICISESFVPTTRIENFNHCLFYEYYSS